jgi:hypothetical protein
MTRTTTLLCDVCRKPTKRIVGKLNFIPMIPGVSRSAHSNYSHHADVGECCKSKILNGINFSQRVSIDEYQARRRGEKIA